MKHIIFCADDYGQNEAISQAIIALLIQKRLSAVSCLTTSPNWLNHSRALIPFKNQIDIGLHFNLTEGKLLTDMEFIPLNRLLLKASLRQLELKNIGNELNAQIDQFVAGQGGLPDFIDGHQHVHHLPIIRDAVLAVYENRLRSHGSYIRSVYQPKLSGSGFIKSLILNITGAYYFQKILISKNIPHNTSFAGVYHFKNAKDYPTLCANFLKHLKNRGLLMCHPGKTNEDSNDTIAEARITEFNFLQSPEFEQLCNKYQIVVSRFK
jgi:chitin disaccharide deacetylase